MAKKDIETQPLSREQLLELQLMNQKVHRAVAQLEALSQRKSSLMMELTILPEREKDLQAQKDKQLEQLRDAYNKAKEQAGVPEGQELDIETGEAISPQQNGQK